MQGFAITNVRHKFCNAFKDAYISTTNTAAPVKSSDGTRLIKDNEVISHRWVEHYSHIFNEGLIPNDSVLTELPQRPTKHSLESPPSITQLE